MCMDITILIFLRILSRSSSSNFYPSFSHFFLFSLFPFSPLLLLLLYLIFITILFFDHGIFYYSFSLFLCYPHVPLSCQTHNLYPPLPYLPATNFYLFLLHLFSLIHSFLLNFLMLHHLLPSFYLPSGSMTFIIPY